GKVGAVGTAPAVIHLRELATGRTLARLEDPHHDRSAWLAFTADGNRLVSLAGYARAVHVWDLALVRRRLHDLGLNGDAAPPPPEPGAPPLTVRVENVPPGP